jgi:hypothetical protein
MSIVLRAKDRDSSSVVTARALEWLPRMTSMVQSVTTSHQVPARGAASALFDIIFCTGIPALVQDAVGLLLWLLHATIAEKRVSYTSQDTTTGGQY